MTLPRKLQLLTPLVFGAALALSGCVSETIEEVPATTTVAPSPGAPQAPDAPQSPGAPQAPEVSTTTVPMMPNPNGDGSMVPCEGTICTNPNHGAGDDPAENGGFMESPNGDGSLVPCEGTICTNPNHGGGDPNDPPEPGQTEMEGPDDVG